MTWEVKLYPEEEAFINEILSRKINNGDGRGDFLAPVRGGIIYLDNYTQENYTEAQIKWLLLNRLQSQTLKMPGVKGIRFMNFTYNNEVPPVMEDPEVMDKLGVPRATTDGQPCSPVTGLPIEQLNHTEITVQTYKWDSEKKEYVKAEKTVTSDYADRFSELPEKILD